MRPLSVLTLGILMMSGCAVTTPGRILSTPEEETLLRTDREFNAATQARGVEGWVSFFAEDGSMLRPQGSITGHEAIRAAMAPAFSNPDFSLTWEPQHVELTPGGRLGYTRGRYLGVHKDAAGNRVESRGTYMNFWRKQPDGSWKVVADVGDPDEAPTPRPISPP